MLNVDGNIKIVSNGMVQYNIIYNVSLETPLGYELPGFHKENYATLLSLIDAGKPRFGNNQISGNLTTNFHDVSYNFALDVVSMLEFYLPVLVYCLEVKNPLNIFKTF